MSNSQNLGERERETGREEEELAWNTYAHSRVSKFRITRFRCTNLFGENDNGSRTNVTLSTKFHKRPNNGIKMPVTMSVTIK
ncbi:hypothetical protein PUN28_001720 [Cardiocondyla obscurior]|uniref:Uncharacterized protein n=1 Tax=Cardiocondyla obscurior TaxID=286306 RepID=A0AAW2GQX9_9HYME